jgi:hypothetical protein
VERVPAPEDREPAVVASVLVLVVGPVVGTAVAPVVVPVAVREAPAEVRVAVEGLASAVAARTNGDPAVGVATSKSSSRPS